MERRNLLHSLALGPLAAGMATLDGAISPAEANWGMVTPGAIPPPGFDGRLLVNKPRAYEIMEREGVDGIVALNPVNVFYLGNYVGYELQKLRAISSFAVMSRDPNKPILMVVSSADLEFIAARDRAYPEVIPYTNVMNVDDYAKEGNWAKEPTAGNLQLAPRPEILTAREQQWQEIIKKVTPRRAATPEWALVRALEELGLT